MDPAGTRDAASLWNRVLEALSSRMAARTIDTILRPLTPLDATVDRLGGVFLLQAPNEFQRDWALRSYGALIEEQLGLLTDGPWSLHWTVAPPSSAATPDPSSSSNSSTPSQGVTRKVPPAAVRKPAAPRAAMVESRSNSSPPRPVRVTPSPTPTGISHGLHPKYTFDNFVMGPSNQLAHTAAVAMADPSGRRFNPLFLCGGTGLGKTHLVNAVGHALLGKNANASVVYVSAEHFTNEFIDSVQSKTMDEFRTRYRNTCEALLIDDVQFFAGKEQTLDEFFHTFNALYQREKPIVITSDVAPQDLKGMPERLLSRFASGLVAEVYAPELETRVVIVRKKAELEGIHLDDEAAFALAGAIATNVRDLEGMLMKLAIKASLAGRSGVDVTMVREALRIPARQTVTTVEDIQRAVCEHYRVKLSQLTGRDRHQEIALPRQVAMYLCRERLGTSFPQLGARFGGKDHTTVISAVNKIKKLVAEDHPVSKDLEAIVSRLGPSFRDRPR